ncbi:DUF692 domain-containing protein [Arhodomonas aquaeolei]|uniref:MNIO family bufferin maturase n=1 Tax=Arhodomonas aquaeolei TaxID=2369 RepID=UPI0021692DB9|nr:DUF692 domain-containing protein [Arhodomonas aquaeolei]MCS4504358.1 DUF692 domain-containing protein [Arhodomonas aquaeolei]
MSETVTRTSVMPPAGPMPARAGVGLKARHYATIVGEHPDVGFFEVHAENYMGAGGPPHAWLAAMRERYPLSVHGVGMNIGGEGALDTAHLARLRGVVERYEPALVSEHLAWSGHGGAYFNDLLPLPYTGETLARVIDHVDQVQCTLGRRVLIENPSTYVCFGGDEMDEVTFLSELARHSGCGLLLDVNNVAVSATNHDHDPAAYIDAFPTGPVDEIHLAGHALGHDDTGAPFAIDSHDRRVADTVWALYERTLLRSGPVPTLIEWDGDVPEWPVLLDEARRADTRLTDAPREATS